MPNSSRSLQSEFGVDFFKDILERQNNPIVRVDAENRFLYISKAYADYFDLDKEAMLGKVFIPPICEEDITCFERTHRQIRDTKKPAVLLQRELTKNGWVWFEWKITPILDDDGKIQGIQSVGQDVSNLIATKDTLSLVFQALEQTSVAVIITDTAGSIIYANQKFKQLYGYKDEDIMGLNPKILKSHLTDQQIYKEMWDTILRGEVYNCEITNKTSNGILRWVLLSISPIKNEDGIITHFVAVSEDIGFQKRLESELREAKKELENINEALEREVGDRTAELRLSNMLLKTQIEERKKVEAEKEQKDKLLAQQSKFASLGEMINMIAHQWRQPLTAISTSAINIKTKQELGILDSSTLDSILDGILSHTQKMSSTINDFLNFFKPSREKEYFEIRTAGEESLKLIGAQLSARGIKLEVLKKCDIKIYGFKNELEQVFINILSNARDAFENNHGENKLIRVECRANGDKITIEFCDNAGGVDEAVFDRVFEPYFTTKEPDKGTGIGLYMSKTILQKSFDGDMKIENIYDDSRRIGLKCIVTINQQEGLPRGN